MLGFGFAYDCPNGQVWDYSCDSENSYDCSNWTNYLNLRDSLDIPLESGYYFCNDNYHYMRDGQNIYICLPESQKARASNSQIKIGNVDVCFYRYIVYNAQKPNELNSTIAENANSVCYYYDSNFYWYNCESYINVLTMGESVNPIIHLIGDHTVYCINNSDSSLYAMFYALNESKNVSTKTQLANQKTSKELFDKLSLQINSFIVNLDELVSYEQYNRALTYLSVDPNKLKTNDLIKNIFSDEFKTNKYFLVQILNRNSSQINSVKFKNLYTNSLNDEKRNNVVANLSSLNQINLANNFRNINNEMLQAKTQLAIQEQIPTEVNSEIPSELTKDQVQTMITNKLAFYGSVLFSKPLCIGCIYVRYKDKYYKYSEDFKLLGLNETQSKEVATAWPADWENLDTMLAGILTNTNLATIDSINQDS